MTETLVIVHVCGGIVETVQVVKKAVDASEDQFLDAAIEKANEIVRKATSDSFDPESDDCRIFAVDEADGSSSEVWSYGTVPENHDEEEEG